MMSPIINVLRTLYFTTLFAYVQRAFFELRPGVPFRYGHHIRAICYKLEQVERGEVKRLLILMPPRHLKSHCGSVAFPVWALGRDPTRRITCMSYGLDLAETFSRESRRLIESDWSRATFPELILDPRRTAVGDWRTTLNGFRMTTSVGGPLTGKGADILIIDDPSKAEDVSSETRRNTLWEWFTGTAMTRLDNPMTGAVIVIAQRLHEDDLPGRLIATGDWDVLELPAIETRDRLIPLSSEVNWGRTVGKVLLPEHMDREALEARRREMGNRAFEAQYQQAPTPAGGNIIRPEWFGTIPSNLRRCDYEALIQSWDPAAVPGESNDYSVCTTWGLIGNYIDLLDVHRQQYLQPDLLRAAVQLRNKWKPNLVVVEAVGVGRGVYDHLRRQNRWGVEAHIPKNNKVDRMAMQSPKIERGEVRMRVNAPWTEPFLSEVAAFPNGKYDDQVDSLSQALKALDRPTHATKHCSRFKGLTGRVL